MGRSVEIIVALFLVVLVLVLLMNKYLPSLKINPKTDVIERIERAVGVVVKKESLLLRGKGGLVPAIVIVVRNEALKEDYYLGIRKGDLDDIKVGHIIEVNFNPTDVIGVEKNYNYKLKMPDGTVIIRPKAEEEDIKVYQIFSYKIYKIL